MADSPPGLIIRAATSSDVPALCSVANDPGYRWGTMRLPYHSPEQTARWFSELGVDDHLLVAELDGEVVGNGGLHRQRGRRAHVALLGMGLREPVHRRGVGTALLAALIDLADDWLNLKRLELTVFVDNQPAITLYERHGFVRGGAGRVRVPRRPVRRCAGDGAGEISLLAHWRLLARYLPAVRLLSRSRRRISDATQEDR